MTTTTPGCTIREQVEATLRANYEAVLADYLAALRAERAAVLRYRAREIGDAATNALMEYHRYRARRTGGTRP